MKQGCLILVGVFLLLILGAGLYLWTRKDAIVDKVTGAFDVPEHGTQGYIDARYGDVIDQLEAAASQAGSVFEFGAAVERLELPEEVIYVGVKSSEDDDDMIPVIEKTSWTGHSWKVIDNYGAGSLRSESGDTDVMIYTSDARWPYMHHFTVFIELLPEAAVEKEE